MPTEIIVHDYAGNPHTYTVVLHKPSEGMQISYEMIRAGGPALPRLIGLVLSDDGVLKKLADAAESLKSDDKNLDLADIVKLVSDHVDLRAAGADLESVLASLDGPSLARRILSRSLRDGAALGNDTNFDTAYAGNYAEMWLAVVKIAQANRFFPVPTGSTSAKA